MTHFPEHYSLVNDGDDHFEVHDHRDNKRFRVAKKGIHPANQIKIMKMRKFAEGGEVKGYAFGGGPPDKPKPGSPEWQTMLDAGNAGPMESDRIAVSDVPQAMGEGMGSALDAMVGGESRPPQQFGKPASQGPVDEMGQPYNPLPQANFYQAPAAPVQATPPPEMQPDLPAINVKPQAQPQTPQMPGMMNPMGAIGAYQQSLMREAKATADQQKQMAEVQKAQTDWEIQNQARIQQNMAQFQQQYEQLSREVADGKIDPSRYWSSKSSASKLSAGIGVILAGMGQGLMHSNSNYAIDMLNHNIDRDIEAQKAELGKKENLLSRNLQAQGNMMAAEAATRAQMQSIAQGKMMAIAAQTNSPILMEKAKQAGLQLQISSAPNIMQVAQAQYAMEVKKQLMSGQVDPRLDPSAFVPHVVPPEHQKQVYAEIKAAQDTRHMADSILAAFEDAARENTVMRTGAGMLRTPGSVLALHQHMQPTFQDLEGTVRQAAMDNTFKNITPAPGDMPSTVAQKRQALQEYLKSKMSAPTAKSFGLDLSKFMSTSQDPLIRMSPQERMDYDYARKNPNRPEARAFFRKHGLSPNG